jgi:hypothetical protein
VAWIPLEQRFAALPLILAGPIVRRVEPHAVTVWLALKETRAVTLRIYAEGPNGKLIEQFAGTHTTVSLAPYLHLVAVTAYANSDEQRLAWGQHYSYNLFFQDPGQNASPSDLYAPGVLLNYPDLATSLQRLVYPGQPLPGFVLPPEEIDRLRIIHGSCRKPGGKGKEMLFALDTLIASALERGEERPQILCLTGDQIYADDVATPLLHTLIDAGQNLFADQTEILPSIAKSAAQLPPTQRHDVVRNLAALTTTTPANHLLSLAEYAAMYLFVWSDILWPTELPALEDLWQQYPELQPRSTDNRDIKKFRASYEQELERLYRFRGTLPAVRRALANIATYMVCDDHDITDDLYLDGAWCRQVLMRPLGRAILRNGQLAFALFQGWGNTPAQFAEEHGRLLLRAISQRNGEYDREIQEEERSRIALIEEILGLPSKFNGRGALPRSERALNWYYACATPPGYQIIALDTRTQRYYHAPDDFPGLLSTYAIQAQLSALAHDKTDLSIIISPAPVLGIDFIETVQFWSRWHVKENYAYDCEAWSLNWGTFLRFLRAVSAMRRVVFLSGDVHYGFGASLDYWDHQTRQPARLINYTASSLRNEGAGAQMAVLAIGYPRLSRLLRREKATTMDFFVWDGISEDKHTLNAILTKIWRRFYRIWWAIPRLIATRRASSALVLPAWGWLRGTFDAIPPDRSYRLTYLHNTQQHPPQPTRYLHRYLLAFLIWLSHFALGIVSLLQAGTSKVRNELLRRIDANNPNPKLLKHPRQTLAREAIGGTDTIELKLEKRRAGLVDNLLQHEEMFGRWKAGSLIIGYNNLGEIGFTWNGGQGETRQRLWWYHPDNDDELQSADYSASLALPEAENEPPLP